MSSASQSSQFSGRSRSISTPRPEVSSATSIGRSGVSISSDISKKNDEKTEAWRWNGLDKEYVMKNRLKDQWDELHSMLRTVEQMNLVSSVLKRTTKELFPSKYKIKVPEVHKDVSNLINEYQPVFLTQRQRIKILYTLGKEIFRKATAIGIKVETRSSLNDDFNLISQNVTIELRIKETPNGTVFTYKTPSSAVEVFQLYDAYSIVRKAVQLLKESNPVRWT
jgi:hypothetical protein